MFNHPRTLYLSSYSPSPTTVFYTVSTRPPNPSARARLLTLLKHAVRSLLVALVLLIILIKVQKTTTSEWEWLDATLRTVQPTGLVGTLIQSLAEQHDWWIVIGVSLAVVYICLRRDYTGKLWKISSQSLLG